MKKFIAIIICLTFMIGMSGCGQKNGNGGEDDAKDPNASMNLTDMVNEICKDTDAPPTDIIDLDKENFNIYSFIPWKDGLEAVCAEAMVSSSAHSVVLIRTGENDSKSIAEEISEKADIRKWICVEAEIGKVLYTDDYVLMIMTYKNSYEPMKTNFEKIVGADKVKVIDIKTS